MPSLSAQELFAQGYNCAQSILLSQAGALDMDADVAVRAAAGFGGGMGRQGLICGALSGAIIVLSLRFGSIDLSDKAAKEKLYERVRRLSDAFAARHGTLQCRDLLGVDISTPEGQAQARETGLFQARCPLFVQSVDQILADNLDNNKA